MYDDEINPTLIGLFSRETLLITGLSRTVICGANLQLLLWFQIVILSRYPQLQKDQRQEEF
jgi:hypothetical protein